MTWSSSHSTARCLVGVAALVAVTAGACSSSSKDTGQPNRTNTIVVAVADEPTSFNWNKSGSETQPTKDLDENLFFYAFKADPNYVRTFPGLEGPPKVITSDPLVVEWTIKKEAVWSDGTPVTSDDLSYFRSVVVAPDSGAADHQGYDQMKDLTVVDDKTIRVTFDHPYSDYQELWNEVPQAAFLRSQPGGFATGLDNEPGPSAGPYKFKEWKRGESITLVRNERWWGTPKPAIEQLVFRFIDEPAAQVQALANGEVDVISPTADADLLEQVKQVAATHDVRYSLAFGPVWDLFTFNLRNPMLADRSVRQAMAYALDRKDIVDKIVGPMSAGAPVLENFIYMNNQPEYQAHGATYRTPDPAAARRLLDEAGWIAGSGGIREKAGQRLSLRVNTPTGNARWAAAAQLATSQLKDVGIELRSDDCTLDCMIDRLVAGDFDILSAGWVGNLFSVNVLRNIFSTVGEQNFGKLESPAFDDLIGQATSVADLGQQAALANRADEVLWEELPGIPLYQVPTLFAASNRFVGMGANPTGDGVFWNSNTWAPRT